MYAILETGGKQYKVQEGDSIKIEKIKYSKGDTVSFDKIVLVSKDGNLTVGKPYIDGATIEGVVTEQGKDKKIIIFKYKPKKDYRKKQGHRQPFTEVEIKAINS